MLQPELLTASGSVKVYLEPLAIAANITQAAFCRMDQVLLSFGFLVMQYQSLTDDPVAQKAVIDSLEMRWKKADQELFIASVLVNPFYRAEPFAATRFMNIAGICALLTRVWRRLNNVTSNPPQQFMEHVTDFLRGEGHFQDLATQLQVEVGHTDRVNAFIFKQFEVILIENIEQTTARSCSRP
jgi:hypothetical protein